METLKLQQDKVEILSEAFYAWQSHPITKEMMKAIELHKQKFVEQIATDSNDYNKPNEYFRCMAGNLRTVMSIQFLMTDFERFVTILNTKK